MNARRILRLALLLLLAAGTRPLIAFQETSLLAPDDGTLYVVRAGSARELGIPANYAPAASNLITWESFDQHGTHQSGILPGSIGSTAKSNLNLAYDEPSSALVLVYREDLPSGILNLLHVESYRGGQWTGSALLPNLGFPHAYNPRMLVAHPVVHTTAADGTDTWITRSILCVTWLEESGTTQARLAFKFLDEDSGTDDVQVYDLPATVGSTGFSGTPSVPTSAYRYPDVQLGGPGGGILVSFADLLGEFEYVVQIDFPDLGAPSSHAPTGLRRHIPIIGIRGKGPLPKTTPTDDSVEVSTYIGSGYNPTLVWHDETAIHFVRFDGRKWSDVNSITFSHTMSRDRAERLVQDMATKN